LGCSGINISGILSIAISLNNFFFGGISYRIFDALFGVISMKDVFFGC
jgi:hypothetical protein